MKIPPVGATFFPCGRTDRYIEANSRFSHEVRVSEPCNRDWEVGNAYGILLDEPYSCTPAEPR